MTIKNIELTEDQLQLLAEGLRMIHRERLERAVKHGYSAKQVGQWHEELLGAARAIGVEELI